MFVINRLADKHWHKLLQDSLGALKNIMRDVDPALYEKNMDKESPYTYLIMSPEEFVHSRKNKEETWLTFEKKAKNANPDLKIEIPYSQNHIVGQYNGLDNGNCVIIE